SSRESSSIRPNRMERPASCSTSERSALLVGALRSRSRMGSGEPGTSWPRADCSIEDYPGSAWCLVCEAFLFQETAKARRRAGRPFGRDLPADISLEVGQV